jgi:hypothetical protein
MRIALLIALLAAGPVAAADFTLFIYESPTQLALRTDPGAKGAAYWQGFAAAGGALAKSGALKGGAALDPTAASLGSGRSPGPTGYFIVTAPNLAAAKALAANIPAARSGRVDIVPHAPTKTGM